MLDPAALEVALNGYAMHLRASELESVAAGLGGFEASSHADLLPLADALRHMPVTDRAPTWELAVRRFGRRKELARAAGEIGMDVVHADELLVSFSRCLATVRAPQRAQSWTL